MVRFSEINVPKCLGAMHFDLKMNLALFYRLGWVCESCFELFKAI